MNFLDYIKYRFSNILKYNRSLIGSSALINARKNYHTIKNIRQAELKVFSQYGEDGIIDYILSKLNINAKISFVEIGTGDYEEANTRYLCETRPCQGYLIDLDKKINFITKRNFYWQNDLKIINKKISVENINNLLPKKYLEDLDLFSLDIDGLDYWILDTLDLSSTKIVILEYNSIFGHDKEVTVPNIQNFDRSNYSKFYFGASLKALINIMKAKNFYFIGANKACCNAFFINFKYQNLFSNIMVDDLSIYTDFSFREIIPNSNKIFNYKKFAIQQILNLELFDLNQKKIRKISDLYK
tara:strand:+ start:22492 stop:23388 length:897 start_codon:yes stop_codon:yes gene_type:complete